MPITNKSSGTGNNFDELYKTLQSIIDAGIGLPIYQYSKSERIELSNKQKLIPATDDRRSQEVWVVNTSVEDITIFLLLGEFEASLIIPPGETWTRTIDGLSSVEVEGRGTINVHVRSDKPIPYVIGEEEMPVPIKVKLLFPTGDNFVYPLGQFYDSNSYEFETNLNNFLNSDITGHKLVVIDQFQPGGTVEFNVEIQGSDYDLTAPVSFQWFGMVKVIQLIGIIASDIINPEYSVLSNSLSGALSSEGWVGNVANGKIGLQPTMTNFVGRFAAKSLVTGSYDTCVLTYTPNSNLYQGGTFTLVGF